MGTYHALSHNLGLPPAPVSEFPVGGTAHREQELIVGTEGQAEKLLRKGGEEEKEETKEKRGKERIKGIFL